MHCIGGGAGGRIHPSLFGLGALRVKCPRHVWSEECIRMLVASRLSAIAFIEAIAGCVVINGMTKKDRLLMDVRPSLLALSENWNCLCTCVSVCLPLCLSVDLTVCLSVWQSVCLSGLPVSPPVCLYMYLCVYVCVYWLGR